MVDVGTIFTIFLPRQPGARQSAPAVATEHAAA
jgi:hypothetical protein